MTAVKSKKSKELVDKLLGGNVPALSRVISLIEDDLPLSEECIELLYPHTGRALIVGVTGSPGAGKSTLVDQLAKSCVAAGKRMAILAVDPSSPFTGGAILGDRIRMSNADAIPEVFIRSMANRGALGGIAPTTHEVVLALDAAGYDLIAIETVGVGQGEIEIVRLADCVIVVLVPRMGDGVQALKAGILEIADIFAINKADHDGADHLERELRGMLNLAEGGAKRPEIVRTIATTGEGVQTLRDLILKGSEARDTASFKARRRSAVEVEISTLLGNRLDAAADAYTASRADYNAMIDDVLDRKTSPRSVSKKLFIGLTEALGRQAEKIGGKK